MSKQCAMCGAEISQRRTYCIDCAAARHRIKARDCARRKREALAATRPPKEPKEPKSSWVPQPIPCAVCGAIFIPKNPRYVTCSKACSKLNLMTRHRRYSKAHAAQLNADDRERRIKGKELRALEPATVERVCKRCGKAFCDSSRYGRKICDDCAKRAAVKGLRPTTCQRCGTVFYGTATSKYCPDCAPIARKEYDKRKAREAYARRKITKSK